jgi:lysyl-tRNA synthetase class 2
MMMKHFIGVFKMNWQVAKRRAHILGQIRNFFESKNVIEVDTPSLSNSTVTDPYLEAFSTKFNYLNNSDFNHYQRLYLQTSPEFHMKRLLTSGFGCIYQICKAFRHEESGRHHNPEFTMLEWYRLGFDQHDLIAEVDELLTTVIKFSKSEKISYQALFIKFVNIDPLTTNFTELYNVIKSYDKAADWLYQSNDVDLLLQFIFSEIIEKDIGVSNPCFVYNFPIAQASLAKECPEDNRVAQRFECYFKGIELANGFNELTDVNIQLARFEQDNSKRQQLGLVTKDIDAKFIAALQVGLPQCSGVALGLDRLMMIALDMSSIDEVISFAIKDA